jgi:hypothetical protein
MRFRAKPERVFRLIALVQAVADQSESVRNAVLRLAEAGLSGLDLALNSPNSFDVVAWSWVRRANERPLSQLQLGALFLWLRVGSHRPLVDASVAALLEEAATRPAKPPTRYHRGKSERRVLVGSVHLYAMRYSR